MTIGRKLEEHNKEVFPAGLRNSPERFVTSLTKYCVGRTLESESLGMEYKNRIVFVANQGA
jgi:hypothetical protein